MTNDDLQKSFGNWHRRRRLRHALVLGSVRGWLREPGLLTRRLRRECPGSLYLVLLEQRLMRLLSSEALALDRPSHEAARVRQVRLYCYEAM